MPHAAHGGLRVRTSPRSLCVPALRVLRSNLRNPALLGSSRASLRPVDECLISLARLRPPDGGRHGSSENRDLEVGGRLTHASIERRNRQCASLSDFEVGRLIYREVMRSC